MSVALDSVSREVGGVSWIRDVSLTLERGSLNVLLGPTLSGKTSIMRLLAGLDRPTSGRVLVDGKDVTGVDVRKRSVAMVYQQFINYPTLTVFENIASPLRVQGRPRAEIEARVNEAARLLKLEPYLNRTPLQLSGGQQQRTAMARALVKGADLVLLDEPLANLDYKLREELRTELPRIFEASGAIFVYATTEPSKRCCSAPHHLHVEGQALQAGATPEVYRRRRRCGWPRCFSDPPLTRSRSRRRAARCSTPAASAPPPPGSTSGWTTAPTRSASARTSSRSAAPPPTARVRHHGQRHRDHRLRELRASCARRLQLVAVLPGVHEFLPGQHVGGGARPGRPLHLRSDRPARRRACVDVRPAMARIDLVDLAHSYGGPPADPASYALKPMTMTWRQGGAYALLGPSGCGKTTLLNIISVSSRRRAARCCSTARTSRRCRRASATSRRCSSSR